ncbi:GSCFA domain-containing protein [Flavobacteriaceae bacterium M23B6Z8]
MKFRTQIPLHPAIDKLNYASKVLLMGSCFSDHIGEKLGHYKFETLSNPFGVIFHPLAIEKLITRAVNQDVYTINDLLFHNERWHCFEIHSQWSNADPEEMLQKLNATLRGLAAFIQSATHIIFTLGTSWIYRHIETDKPVANCHKIPQSEFLKEILSVNEIAEILDSVESLIRLVNQQASIIYTISPVRHLKDGFVENQRSKAHLISAVHEVVAPRMKKHYFPAYELLMDELRDYRFYMEDMIHPNKTAVRYIWEQFNKVWIDPKVETVMKEIDAIQSGLAHRPFDADSEAHKQFKESLQKRIDQLLEQYPFMKF